ncbi:MAG: hypothetical protein OXG16_12220 [Rhodospirillales bacterium]|nr:hypothetical protein [Rhodospirillales bacterium]
MNMAVTAAAPSTAASAVNTVGSVFVVTEQGPNGIFRHATHTIVDEMERNSLLVHRTEYSPPHEELGGPCDGANGNLFDARSFDWIGRLKDGELLAQKTPHTGMFAWSLQVGNVWRWKARWSDYAVRPDFSGPDWTDYEVKAYEEVKVPAGTFMACRVEIVRTQYESHTEMAWFAPEIRQVIKGTWSRTSKNGYGAASLLTWELVSVDFK